MVATLGAAATAVAPHLFSFGVAAATQGVGPALAAGFVGAASQWGSYAVQTWLPARIADSHINGMGAYFGDMMGGQETWTGTIGRTVGFGLGTITAPYVAQSAASKQMVETTSNLVGNGIGFVASFVVKQVYPAYSAEKQSAVHKQTEQATPEQVVPNPAEGTTQASINTTLPLDPKLASEFELFKQFMAIKAQQSPLVDAANAVRCGADA